MSFRCCFRIVSRVAPVLLHNIFVSNRSGEEQTYA